MLKSIIDTTFLHLKRASTTLNQIKKFNLEDSLIEDDNEITKTIDAFIFRYTKLQDFVGDKLFKRLLAALGEYKSNMSYVDVLDKLEKLEIISSSSNWIKFRQLRNQLTQEYPDDISSIISGIMLATNYFEILKNDLINIKEYIYTKKLLDENY
ncbi:MAG: hypothetical protein GX121_01615 [Ignavibacteria bacterium]|nr:hypothetical protein [Ignavibacteria bacterium]